MTGLYFHDDAQDNIRRQDMYRGNNQEEQRCSVAQLSFVWFVLPIPLHIDPQLHNLFRRSSSFAHILKTENKPKENCSNLWCNWQSEEFSDSLCLPPSTINVDYISLIYVTKMADTVVCCNVHLYLMEMVNCLRADRIDRWLCRCCFCPSQHTFRRCHLLCFLPHPPKYSPHRPWQTWPPHFWG